MKRGRWTTEEQKRQIGSAMAIATTANLLLGLRHTEAGRNYLNAMVTDGGMDGQLGEAGTEYILIPMLPFAVELCFKGIKSQGGEFLWTHNLKSLWEDLDENERVGIRTRMEDAAWRSDERIPRDALGIAGPMRTVDEVIEVHQNDFADWRYVVDGERNLTEDTEQLRIDEAILDFYGIVYAAIEHHKNRDAQHQ